MIKQSMINRIAVVLFLCSAAFAQWDNNRGVYLGASVGRSDLSDLSPEQALDVDDEDIAYGLTLGFQFNRYIALETEYLDLGEISVGQAPAGALASADASGARFSVVGMLPLSQRFSAVGKLGLFAGDVDERFFGQPADSSSDVASAIDLGIQYKLTNHVFLSLDWSNYDLEFLDFTLNVQNNTVTLVNVDRDAELLKLGVRYLW